MFLLWKGVNPGAEREDPVLSVLGGGLRDRRLLKGREVPGDAGPKLVEFDKAARRILEKAEIDTEYMFDSDTPTDTPYKDYDFMEQEDPGQLFVENHSAIFAS